MNEGDMIDMTAASALPNRGDELFRFFARFEYALKEIGYGRARNNGKVEANWDCFANKQLTSKFYEHVRNRELAPTIFSDPPSHQTLVGNTLNWEKTNPPTDVQTLVAAVRRVRNNLAHGGKSGDQDSDRNDLLVEEAIKILAEALLAHPDLRAVFEGKW